jgi:hypothetical protein
MNDLVPPLRGGGVLTRGGATVTQSVIAPHAQWKEEPFLLQHTVVAVPAAIFEAVVSLVVGCAGPTDSSASVPAASALAPPSELAGTWVGPFREFDASAGLDEGKCVVQVTEDDTFTATCGTRMPGFWRSPPVEKEQL